MIRSRRFTVVAAAGLALALGPSRGWAQTSEDAGAKKGVVLFTKPGDFEWRQAPSGASFARLHGDPSGPGPFAFRMKMPAHWTMTPHKHNTGEYVTVIRGTLYMIFREGGERTALGPGSVAVIPAGTPMWAWTGDEETIIQIHGVGPFETTRVESDDSG